MPYRLLASRVGRDSLDGQVNFDEALGIVLCHGNCAFCSRIIDGFQAAEFTITGDRLTITLRFGDPFGRSMGESI
jgi:hypothetical protein